MQVCYGKVGPSFFFCAQYYHIGSQMKEMSEGKHLGTTHDNIVHVIDRGFLLTKLLTQSTKKLQPHANPPQSDKQGRIIE